MGRYNLNKRNRFVYNPKIRGIYAIIADMNELSAHCGHELEEMVKNRTVTHRVGGVTMKKKKKQEFENARQKLANELDKFVKVSRNLLEPLKGLNEIQVAALVTLGFLMRAITLAGRPTAKIDKRIMTRFKEVVDEICPPLGKVTISKDPCFEATVSYLSTLKKCEDEGRNEDECFEAWGYGASAVMCTMKELEEMKGQLADIFGRLKPPRPIPWPK